MNMDTPSSGERGAGSGASGALALADGRALLRPQDDVDLDKFIDAKDRSEFSAAGPPFFSGRQRELDVFREVFGALERGKRANATCLVEGPPGAGKSALMEQCMMEASARPPTHDGRIWLPVFLDPYDAQDARAIERAVDRAVTVHLASPAGRAERKRLVDDMWRIADASGEPASSPARMAVERIEAALPEFGAAHSADEEDGVLDALGESLRSLIERAKGSVTSKALNNVLDRGWSLAGFSLGPRVETSFPPSIGDLAHARRRNWRPYQILLCIDEGQNISETGPDGRKGTLAAIHMRRTEAAMSLCVFGLPETRDALQRAGISRFAGEQAMVLGPLEDRDCELAARRCFAQFRVRGAETWVRTVTEKSNRWPQHLSSYLTAAMRTLREHPMADGGCDAGQADLGGALRKGDSLCRDYYSQRLASLGSPQYRHWAVCAARGFLDSPSLPLSHLGRLLTPEEDGLPVELAQRNAFVNAGIRSGLLASDPFGRLSMPIPSFRDFLLEGGNARPPGVGEESPKRRSGPSP